MDTIERIQYHMQLRGWSEYRLAKESGLSQSTIANIFRANIIDVTPESLIIEITGNQSKVDALLKMLEGKEILELARTGLAGLGRGTDKVIYIDD